MLDAYIAEIFTCGVTECPHNTDGYCDDEDYAVSGVCPVEG